jgi:hypothetical protein
MYVRTYVCMYVCMYWRVKSRFYQELVNAQHGARAAFALAHIEHTSWLFSRSAVPE